MFEETLYSKTKQVLDKIGKEKKEIADSFYLAGGTALALQIGHRKSIDLDFFTHNFPNIETLKSLISSFNPKVTNENKNTLDVLIDGVKVTFLEYKYPDLNNMNEYSSFKLASVEDIACMKLSAISSRGSKKDYIDLYYILQKYDLKELFTLFEKKFMGVSYSKKHILRSLNYFEDGDNDPDVDYIGEGIQWDKVKKYISERVVRYMKREVS